MHTRTKRRLAVDVAPRALTAALLLAVPLEVDGRPDVTLPRDVDTRLADLPRTLPVPVRGRGRLVPVASEGLLDNRAG